MCFRCYPVIIVRRIFTDVTESAAPVCTLRGVGSSFVDSATDKTDLEVSASAILCQARETTLWRLVPLF